MNKTIRISSDTKSVELDHQQYFYLLPADKLAVNQGLRIMFDDEFDDYGDLEIALLRTNTDFFAVSNICPHKHAPKIYEGIIRNGTVTCPLHAWKYDLETGNNMNTEDGIKKLKKYQIKIIDGIIYIEKPKAEIPAWRTAEI